MTKIKTRFAPSPTGYLHIGGARTALFNYLYAAHTGGDYLLRIEDTDRERSTKEAIDAIFDGLSWLGITSKEEPIFQSSRMVRHQEVAHTLLKNGKAYYCKCTPEELDAMRTKAREEGLQPRYDGRCANASHKEGALRLKMPSEGTTTARDLVQGPVSVENKQLDDLILLRSDGSPTYLLSVVVDDHDMEITHVIRGDDHLTNTFRQLKIYEGMGWSPPSFAHIPLIHGDDGAKLSKRHGALGVDAYRDMGYLPEAMCNYLLRLGWSHGDEEIISRENAILWFDLPHVGKSAARLDFKKLSALNAHYLREKDNKALVSLVAPFMEKNLNTSLSDHQKSLLEKGMNGLKQRAQTLVELAENAAFYVQKIEPDEKAQKFLTDENKALVEKFTVALENVHAWDEKNLEENARAFSEKQNIGLGKLAQTLRAMLTGRTVSPSVFEILSVLGKEKSINLLKENTH